MATAVAELNHFFSFTVDSSGKCMISSAHFLECFVSAATAVLSSVMKVTGFLVFSFLCFFQILRLVL